MPLLDDNAADAPWMAMGDVPFRATSGFTPANYPCDDPVVGMVVRLVAVLCRVCDREDPLLVTQSKQSCR